MSSSDRADGRSAVPRDVFSMPRDYSFSCAPDSGKEKRRERDALTKRISGSISLDGGASCPPSKRRVAGGEQSYTGRLSGISTNGWHEDLISRNKGLVELGTQSGMSSGGAAPISPKLEYSGGDGSPKELDSGYRISKPGSPFAQARSSHLVHVSHNSFIGKGFMAREQSRCSEWQAPYKMDMDFRDRIWGKFESHRRAVPSGYDTAAVPTVHKDTDGRQEDGRHDSFSGGAVDSAGGSSYHIRSYQEWRHGDRITSSLLPLRTHSSSNGYLKESGARTKGVLDVVVESFSSNWHSPLSSPVNHTADFGRDDGSQMSPRKRPRLGWGQGLAKYEKKRTEGTEDSPPTKGRLNSCSEEIIISHPENLHQGAGDGQEISFANALVVDGMSDPCFKVEKEIPILQIEQIETAGIGAMMDKNRECGSMHALVIDRLDSGQSSDVSLASKEYESTVMPVQPQIVSPGQCCGEDALGSLKENILQRLEKLELELELTEKELAKLEVQHEFHIVQQNGCVVEGGRNSVAIEIQAEADTVGHNDSGEKVPQNSVVMALGKAVIDEQIDMSPAGIQETSLCLLAKDDNDLQPLCEVQHQSASDSLPKATVIGKGDDGLIQHNEDSTQGSGLKGGSLSASFSKAGEITSGTNFKETFVENLPQKGGIQMENIDVNSGILNRKEGTECWKVLYDKNQDQAKHAFQALANLLPEASILAGGVFYGRPEDVPVWEENMECNERYKQQLQNMVVQAKLFLRFREQVLALKYRALRETWKREQAGLCQWSDRTEGLRKWDIERRNGTLLSTQRTSHRLRLSVCGAAKVDAASDEIHTMQKLLAEPFGSYQRLYLKMPCQILDEKERHFRRFITNNALIEDPIAFEQERKTINPWTPEEKKVFLDTFFLYNKNFQKIASFLEHKTIADCIEFYYRNQKSKEFETVRHRQQLKNRRDYSRPSAYLATTTPPSSRRREINAVGVDVLPIPTAVALYNDDGSVFRSSMSNNAYSNFSFVDLSSSDNPPGNSGLTTGINGSTAHPNKMKGAQSMCSQSLTSKVEEFESRWTDNERQLFVAALRLFGKDFGNISQHVATKNEGQCKAFFSKTRKRLGLDQVLETFHTSMHEHFDQQMGDTEVLNTTTSVEDMYADTARSLADAKDGQGTEACECSLVACNDRVEMVSANLTKELLVSDMKSEALEKGDHEQNLKSKDPEKGEDEQNIEDEKLVALSSQVTNDMPGSSEEKVFSIDNEERTECKDQVIPLFLIGSLSTKKDDMADNPSKTVLPVLDSGSDAECMNGALVEQLAHTGEQLTNTEPSKPGGDDGTRLSASEADAFERSFAGEKELFVYSINQITNECPKECPTVTQISQNSSNLTCAAPATASSSVVTPNTQSKGRGSTSGGEAKPRREATSWTQDEKEKFVEIIRKHGRDWVLLQENLPAKSLTQIKTYFQNSKAKLGFTAGEGTTNLRSAASRKSKVDDSDSSSTLHHLAHHKACTLSDDSGFKSDLTVNGSLSTMLGIPGSDGLSFTLSGKGAYQAEDPTMISGLQKLFQQMFPNGYSQQPVAASNLFPLFHASALPVLTASGLQQPQNLNLQQSLSHSTSSKQQLVSPQTQQAVGIQQQSQVSSAMCNLESQLLHQIKQQQKASQVVSHCPQDYQNQNQGIHQLQKWIMQQQQQQQVMQSLQPNISPTLLHQQQLSPPQPQVVLQQPNQQQHLPQGALHIHVIDQNLHYLKQQSSHQPFSQLTAIAGQLLPSNPQINQHQLPSQQQLTHQFQCHQHSEDQQKQHHVSQNQVSQQQHSLLGTSQEQLALKLHHRQQHLQSEKRSQPVCINLQAHLLENLEISHQQQGQALEILSEKGHKQCQDMRNCQSVTLHRGASQVICKDASNLCDSIESRNVPKSQHCESEHLQSSEVNVQVLDHTKSKPGVLSESHQTKAGDVKLFGQFLLSQPASCVKSAASSSQKSFQQPTFSFSSIPVSTVATSVSEALPGTFPNGTLAAPPGIGRIGVSFSHGQDHHPWQGAAVGSFGAWNSLMDGRQHASLAKVADSEIDTQNNQAAVARVTQRPICEAKDCESSHSEGSLSSQKSDVGEQLKRLQDGQTLIQGFGIKTVTDRNSSLVIRPAEPSGTNFDLRSDIVRVSGVSDLSSMMGRSMGADLCSPSGTLLGAPVISSQSLSGAVMDAFLALADCQGAQGLWYGGGRSSEEYHPCQDSLRNNACSVIEGGKSSGTSGQALSSVQSFAGGGENPQVTKDNSIFAQQAVLQVARHAGLNVSMWAASGSDLQRVIIPAVSSIRSHGSMAAEGQPQLADSRDTEDSRGVA